MESEESACHHVQMTQCLVLSSSLLVRIQKYWKTNSWLCPLLPSFAVGVIRLCKAQLVRFLIRDRSGDISDCSCCGHISLEVDLPLVRCGRQTQTDVLCKGSNASRLVLRSRTTEKKKKKS